MTTEQEIWKCRFCDKELVLYSKYTKSSHLIKCKTFKKWKNETLTKEFLIQEYLIEEKSALEIAIALGFTSTTVIDNALKLHSIEKRNMKTSKSTQRCIDKTAATNIERYGAHNPYCKESTSRIAWEKRLLDEEGITNVFQRPEVVYKIQNSLRVKYGHTKFTKIHKKVVDYLTLHEIDNEIEFGIKYKNAITSGGYKFYDIKIANRNLLIEINGDYWHASPTKFKATDIFQYRSGPSVTAQDVWDRDAEKIKIAADFGYSVLTLWEHEIKNDTFEEKLWNYLKYN